MGARVEDNVTVAGPADGAHGIPVLSILENRCCERRNVD